MANTYASDTPCLPSYQDAIARVDWLDLVAPYMNVKHYARLCRVSKRFYAQFAPRLWNDPVTVVCLLSRDPVGQEHLFSPF
jgi:hypothetical protein